VNDFQWLFLCSYRAYSLINAYYILKYAQISSVNLYES